LFCRLLGEHCKVDFMGIVEWFLGVHFSWRITSSSVAVHLNNRVLHLIWLRASLVILVTLLQRLLLIETVFQ
jgi:hypothetical protein